MHLHYVDQHRAALDWTDAGDALRRETRLVPALQEQLARAKNAASEAQSRLNDADKALENVMSTVNDAKAKAQSIEESLNRDREDWSQLGIEDATDEIIAAERARISEFDAEIANVETKEKEVFKQLNQFELLRSQADQNLASALEQLDDAENAWKPEQERWQRLQTSAKENEVLAPTLTRRFMDAFSGLGSPNLRQRARDHAAALKERLASAREAQQVETTVKELLGQQELSGEICLKAWLEVRNWLRLRMPTQIAEIDEPLKGLEHLREHLAALEIRLKRQETELRGESEDVARNIDIHIRRAHKPLMRLFRLNIQQILRQ
jgi:chromosome partition protein MukB